MAEEYLEILDNFEVVDRLIRREPIVRDRSNPFVEYNEEDFLARFRLPKAAVMQLLHRLGDGLDPAQHRVTAIPPILQLLVALRFYATSSFLRVDGDLVGIDISTVSRIVARVSRKIAALRGEVIQFPSPAELPRLQRDFMELGGIPGIVGAIDCTHIPIRSPGGGRAEQFRNRKGYVPTMHSSANGLG